MGHGQGAGGGHFAHHHHVTGLPSHRAAVACRGNTRGLAADEQLGHLTLLLAADVEDFVRALLLQPEPGDLPTPEARTPHQLA
ncbi:hypothetical protein D3C71_1592190 [compost metagenome]